MVNSEQRRFTVAFSRKYPFFLRPFVNLVLTFRLRRNVPFKTFMSWDDDIMARTTNFDFLYLCLIAREVPTIHRPILRQSQDRRFMATRPLTSSGSLRKA
ncbi:hypothetical protein PHET_04715 [Paragonimus heterotremus]|uniref:Uncharacterized protein n=1 Tax=Paragonimus heterotremus TaxID=100268 RepID=A0A8J4T1D9_9TREM|nr:hypothetical protein PHET_04715 [Paragonimus heterotremus]